MSIKNGDLVSVHYIGTFEDGTEFDRSQENNPLTFKVGSGQVIEGFDKAVIGKAKGDTFTVTIPPAEAYGEYDEELVFEVDRSQLPSDITPEVGMALHMETEQGAIEAVIVEVKDDTLALDANFPMAGEALTFEMTIV